MIELMTKKDAQRLRKQLLTFKLFLIVMLVVASAVLGVDDLQVSFLEPFN